MGWKIILSKNADKFVSKNKISISKLGNTITKVIAYFEGSEINVDIVKMKGKWKHFHRIRVGEIRIISEFNFEDKVVYIEEIDYRGSIYK